MLRSRPTFGCPKEGTGRPNECVLVSQVGFADSRLQIGSFSFSEFVFFVHSFRSNCGWSGAVSSKDGSSRVRLLRSAGVQSWWRVGPSRYSTVSG